MFGFNKSAVAVLLSFIFLLGFSGCADTQTNEQELQNFNSLEESSELSNFEASRPASSEEVPSAESKETNTENGNFTVTGIDGENYCIDLKDMHMISHTFIGPLIVNGHIWGYDWKTPKEIHADDLINFCAYANFWNYPQDFEGCYLPDQNTQKADLVEDKILEHFDVDREYLKTSFCYLPDDDVYELISGCGGGWEAIALSADLQGDLLKIEVGYYTSFTVEEAEEYRRDPENQLSGGYYSPDRIIGEDGRIIIPGGTLTVRLEDGVIKYQSWISRPDIDF